MSKWTDRWDLHQCWKGNTIIRYHKHHRFFNNITGGDRGMGKTMLDIQTMAYVSYWSNGKDEEMAWRYALDNILFLPSQLEQRIDKNEEEDICSMVWCLDDAAVHFSNKLWWIDQGEAILLESIFDLIRPVVAGLLINCTQKTRLMTSLQNYGDYETTIYIPEGNAETDRKAITIHWYRLPSGDWRYDKVDEERFSVIIPDKPYEEYRQMRKKYIRIIRDKQKEYRDRVRKQNKNVFEEMEKVE